MFIDWTPENTTAMLGYMSGFIADLTPLLMPIIAIGLGLIVFTVIVRAIRGN